MFVFRFKGKALVEEGMCPVSQKQKRHGTESLITSLARDTKRLREIVQVAKPGFIFYENDNEENNKVWVGEYDERHQTACTNVEVELWSALCIIQHCA